MEISSTLGMRIVVVRMALVNLFEGLEKSSYGYLMSSQETGCNRYRMHFDVQVSVPLTWKSQFHCIN